MTERRYRSGAEAQRLGKCYTVTKSGGEEYAVACPFCGAPGRTLRVNHRWGVPDYSTGEHFHDLAECDYGNCFADRKHRHVFQEDVEEWMEEDHWARTGPPFPAAEQIRRLSSTHAADRFLGSLKFDPMEISRTWHAYWCQADVDFEPAIRTSLVVPFADANGERVGWRSWRIDDDGDPSAPLTSPEFDGTNFVYGLSQASRPTGEASSLPLVVCYGTWDVWRLGVGAVAVLSRQPTEAQAHSIIAAAEGRAIVVFPNSGAAAKTTELLGVLQGQAGKGQRVFEAVLPESRERVLDCGRDEAWACVHGAVEVKLNGGRLRRRLRS